MAIKVQAGGDLCWKLRWIACSWVPSDSDAVAVMGSQGRQVQRPSWLQAGGRGHLCSKLRWTAYSWGLSATGTAGVRLC